MWREQSAAADCRSDALVYLFLSFLLLFTLGNFVLIDILGLFLQYIRQFSWYSLYLEL